MGEDSLLWPTEEQAVDELAKVAPPSGYCPVGSARDGIRTAVTRMFEVPAPEAADEDYSRKAARAPRPPSAKAENVLTPTSVSMSRYETWLDADRQAAMVHSWLMAEDWNWLAGALGLVVDLTGLPRTISASKRNPDRANIEIHSVRTAMKRGSLGWPEQHMVVVVTQWRAGFFDRDKQEAHDGTSGAWGSDQRDFKYRAGCTLMIDPGEMRIRRVIRTPGTVADPHELDRMRNYLLKGLDPPDAFAPIARRLLKTAEPFALLHAHGGA